ncbi:MAG TPA: hypothetical protein VGM96_21515 [Reyranella sp.]
MGRRLRRAGIGMMGQALRDIGTLFNFAYSDALRLIRTAWWVIGLLLILVVAAAILGALVSTALHTALARELVGTLASILGLWLAAPYFVSLYRLVLTNTLERPESFRHSDIARHFFAWSAVLTFIISIPTIAYAALDTLPKATIEGADQPVNLTQTFATFVLLIAVWIFATRAITLLPGAAMGRVATLREALAETRGRFWFIVGAVVAAVLPVVITSAIIQALVAAALGDDFGFISQVIAVATVMFAAQLSISLSARLFQKLAPEPAPPEAP